MDGARTAILILFVGGIYLVFVLAAETGHLKRALLITTSGLILVATAAVMSGIVQGQPGSAPEGGLGRVGQLSGVLQEQGFDGLELADATRFQMLDDAVAAIRSHPVLGSGIITTTTESTVGPQAVHMTYLQVWADLGLLGLIAYVWLVWGWIPWVPAALRRISGMSDPVQRALHHNAIFLLLVYGVIGFFHPLSTEWSEWIIFIVAYAILWPIAAGDKFPVSCSSPKD
jgi:O-antigen ligase